MYKIIKRLFDVISATVLFIVLLPLFLIITVLVRLNLGSPVFFLQERSGLHGKPFKIIKFRTMREDKDSDGKYLPEELRITRLGRFLRSTSLDELPELINIIFGAMSVIGPRPLPPIYDHYYHEHERARFNVRSGLIPPDSIDKEPILSWDRQLAYEAEYATNLSLKIDLRIFFSVIRILMRRKQSGYGGIIRIPLNEERKTIRNTED